VDRACHRIWSSIRDELVALQDKAPDNTPGQVVNPITGLVYLQNTSCAALVFATEYVRSGESRWLSRAQFALDSLSKVDIYCGVDEPKWDRLGWHYNRGSLFVTGTLLDTYLRALGLLGQDVRENAGLFRVLRYLETCRIAPGLFAHDSVPSRQKPPSVQNINAIALYLMESVTSRTSSNQDAFLAERDATLRFLLRGQRSDGFWPYVYPGALQQITFQHSFIRRSVRYVPVARRYFLKQGDASIFFGDGVHHCLVLYYLVKSIALRQPNALWSDAVARGWAWICRHLVHTEGQGIGFDFDWEPIPTGFRYANFRDTSTYFLILALLPLLAGLGIIEEDYRRISTGFCAHIERNLLHGHAFPTSIRPYEGAQESMGFILPRVGEASAWKGALLAEFLICSEGTGS
jgi:hypothetical protein